MLAKELQISKFLSLNEEEYIKKLKTVKETYLKAKVNHEIIYDTYVLQSNNLNLASIRKKEYLKLY